MGNQIERFQGNHEKKSEVVVVVDGPSASGKGTLAEHVAEKLNTKHFSASDVFYSIAEERGFEDHELSEEAGKDVDIEVDRKTLERGLEQSCVIDGRITAWVLGDYADLRIHLDADLEERADRLAKREGYGQEEAREIVEKRDSEDYRRYQEYYGIDPGDRSNYDVLIDNTELNIEQQNSLIDQVLEQVFPGRFGNNGENE